MLDKDEVKKAYVNADIFLLPSYSENFGLTIIESMACGCPIIISRNVNIYEKIDKNNLGYVIDCKTSEITDSVIDYYYKPDSFKKSHSAKIKNFALTNYDWDLYIKDFITLYEQLL